MQKKSNWHKLAADILNKAMPAIDEQGEQATATPGQVELSGCILHRQSPTGKLRIHAMTPTQYGKSFWVGKALSIRLATKREKWAIVAGTKDKARIIMEYVIHHSLTDPLVRVQLQNPTQVLDRLKARKSQDRLTYLSGSQVRVFSGDVKNIKAAGDALMGFGAPNVIEDESALIPDIVHAKVMRMLGSGKNNFLMKIGNPFVRNHFYRSFRNKNYFKINIDYHQALKENRFTQQFIDEMKQEPLFDIFYEVKFPESDVMDASGYMQLLTDEEVDKAQVDVDTVASSGHKRLGVDAAGGGRNFSVFVLRDDGIARVLRRVNESDTMRLAGYAMKDAIDYNLLNHNIIWDKVGIGRGSYDRLKEMREGVVGFSGADSATSPEYYNLRAQAYWELRSWIKRGGLLIKNAGWDELKKIKYKINPTNGKIQIISKKELMALGIPSPDVADALSMTFASGAKINTHTVQAVHHEPVFDPYASSNGGLLSLNDVYGR